MRTLIAALCFAFALGGFASSTAFAGEGGCDYGSSHKKNDFETPPPDSSSVPRKG